MVFEYIVTIRNTVHSLEETMGGVFVLRAVSMWYNIRKWNGTHTEEKRDVTSIDYRQSGQRQDDLSAG